MNKLCRIYIILLVGLFISARTTDAGTVTDCYENLCASITVPECVTPNTDFEVLVEGDNESGADFSVFGFRFYENADWTYTTADHLVKIISGTMLDENGFNWGSSYANAYVINRPAGTYSYTFSFGDRSMGMGFKDVGVEIDVNFSTLSSNVALDIKPGSCPNPLNVNKKGVLSAAVLGSADFDVTQIDPESVQLAGIYPIHYSYEDVATPYEPLTGKSLETDCTTSGADGYTDLTVKFKARDVADALKVSLGRELIDGEVLVISATGDLAGGSTCESTINGEDVIRIIKKK